MERLKQSAQAALAVSIALPTGLRACTLACQNAVPSHLVLVTTSDCALHAVDAAVGAPVATVAAAHSRPIGKLAFVLASPYGNADTAAVACNTFLASSKGPCVRLWDVRAMKAVRQFGGELQGCCRSSGAAAAAAVSACGRFVACSAADREAVLLFDVRTSRELDRLQQVRSLFYLGGSSLCVVK